MYEIFGYTIEISYILIFAFLTILGIALYTEKINPFVILTGMAVGIILGLVISPFSSLVLTPLWNSIWHGYEWGLLEYSALIFIFSAWYMLIIYLVNLYMTKGKTGWL